MQRIYDARTHRIRIRQMYATILDGGYNQVQAISVAEVVSYKVYTIAH
jgi:hypothetical protein